MSSHHHKIQETTCIPTDLTFSLGDVLKASLRELKINYRGWMKLGGVLFCIAVAELFSREERTFLAAYDPRLLFQSFERVVHYCFWLLLNMAVTSFCMVVGSRFILKGEKYLVWDKILTKSFQKIFLFKLGITFLIGALALIVWIGVVAINQWIPWGNTALMDAHYRTLSFLSLIFGGGSILLILLYTFGRLWFYPQALVAGHDQALCCSWKLTKGCVFRIYIGYNIPIFLSLVIWGCLMMIVRVLNAWCISLSWEQYLSLIFQVMSQIFLSLFHVAYCAILFKTLDAPKEEARLEPRVQKLV